jgi:transaldolase
MRPEHLATRIFLDGGNPDETEEIMGILGFLDGQTTNPTLISKNPGVRERMERGERFTRERLNDYYRDVVREISAMMPEGSVSVEVYSDASSKAGDLLAQAREMFSWIPNAHIKFPTSSEGLEAASLAIGEGMRVNMTLCFSQTQAAAVYAATRGARKGDVFVSPFIGRLDDKGENGMDLIAGILRMYEKGDGHVEVLTASVRNLDHLMCAIKLGSHIATVPFQVLKEWGKMGLPMPGADYAYDSRNLRPMPYLEVDLSGSRHDYDIRHELTDKGMERFSQDWNSLIQS